jgi:hypothetical protein
MFLRFVTLEMDTDSQARAGIFTAAYRLWREGDFPEYERERLEDILMWFNLHLDSPSRLYRKLRRRRKQTAICWFKPSAHKHLEMAWEMAMLLWSNEIIIQTIKTKRPGYIVYEDSFQIAAEPFDEVRRM